MHFTCYSSS